MGTTSFGCLSTHSLYVGTTVRIHEILAFSNYITLKITSDLQKRITGKCYVYVVRMVDDPTSVVDKWAVYSLWNVVMVSLKDKYWGIKHRILSER